MSMRGLLLCFAIVLILGAFIGQAYGRGHAENHDWYKGLISNAGGSCCNALTAEGEGDCRPAAVWREADGTVRAKINGRTVVVPPRAVLPDWKNLRPLTGHACEKNGQWHCALVGGAGG